jgi:hypothetical protein
MSFGSQKAVARNAERVYDVVVLTMQQTKEVASAEAD